MKQSSSNEQRRSLLRLIEESYVKKAWHGPNLRGSLRGIALGEASWRPAPDKHNIWEIVVHCAYWKYIVRRRILGEQKGSFPLKGSNWFKRPMVLTPEALRQDITLLDETHQSMVDAIRSLDVTSLPRIPKNSKVTNEAIIRGIALHDVYHAGQIQLLKRLMK
ncbi:MAG TPA: DinB family protein [Bacteroidota bacterium]